MIYGEDEKIAQWVAQQIPHVSDFGPCIAIGVTSDKSFLAGVVYHDYQPLCETIQLSMAAASPMWARKKNIAELLKYPFEQLMCYKVYTTTPADNEPALRVNKHIGFKREAVLAHQFGKGRHGVIMRMLLPDYKRLYGAK